MIKKIEQIKNFGCFENFAWDKDNTKEFAKVNLIFGYNGSGKTTLSNLLYLLSTNNSDKTEISNEYLQGDGGFQIVTSNYTYSETNYDKFDEILYVFNSKFINDHIFDGSKSKMSSFALKSKISNEMIDKIDENLKQIVKRTNYLTRIESQLITKLDDLWKSEKTNFRLHITGRNLTDNPKVTDYDNDNIDINRQKLERLYSDYTKHENIGRFEEVIQLINGKTKELTLLSIDIKAFTDCIGTSINKDVLESIKLKITEYEKNVDMSKQHVNINDWLISGKILLDASKGAGVYTCPLCNSNIESIIDGLIGEYDSYFNEKLRKLFLLLDEFEIQFKSVNSLLESNQRIIADIIVHLKYLQYTPTNTLFFDVNKLEQASIAVSDAIAAKRREPNKNIILSENYFSEIKAINNRLSKFITELNTFIQTQRDEIKKLSSRDVLGEIKSLVKKIAIIEFNLKKNCVIPHSKKFNSQVYKIIGELKKANNKILRDFNQKRENEIAKLELETKFVNIYLEYLGISDFIIKRSKEENDNIIISYKSGTQKRTLKYSLSEGEKTALAFAFFLSKIRAEQIEGQGANFKNIIIVIDDPISSLDENRLYQTANLIDTFFHYNELAESEIPLQTFILSHNITFLKYICNIFYANPSIQDNIQEYFIEPTNHSLTKIPNGLKNFTSTYLEKLDEIIVYLETDSRIVYDVAKKYIPNYIRIVLESFLSFKLALVKEDSKGRVPGLSFLIKKALKELAIYDEDVEIAKINKKGVEMRLNNLKHIADNESHGSLSKIESLNYISEKELKEYCKQTLQVIEYFDKIHYSKAKSLIVK